MSSGGKFPSPTAPGCCAPPSWAGSGSTAKAAASWNPSLPYGQELPLRRELPTASVTTLISEMVCRRLTSLDVILKAPTDYRFLRQQRLLGKLVAPPIDRRRFEAELPNDIWRMTPYMG
ncbi:hypothetical protein DFAR_3170022 [Desulfarculales bacterium]